MRGNLYRAMDEILFRAKAINRDLDREYGTNYKNGDWVYGLIIKPYDERFPKLPAKMRNTDGINGIEVDYKTIGMWTGKLDCGENYIFEGDILQDVDTGERVVVQWFPEHSSFMVWRIAINKIAFLYSFLYYRNLKVVGNIYDSQNLIDKAMGEFDYES